MIVDTKAVSLDELSGMVRTAFYQFTYALQRMQLQAARVADANGDMPIRIDDWYVIDIYADSLVCTKSSGEYYRVAFSVEADGVKFSAIVGWQPVEKEWVDKTYPQAGGDALKHFDSLKLENVIAFGGEVKALGNGRVGGFLVSYSTEKDPDLVKDFFDTKSDLDIENGDQVTVYYDHGLDATLKNRKLARSPVEYKDAGLWLEAQLELRDEYEKYVYKMAQDGKLGWSSGPAQHLVRKEPSGKSFHITHWPIKEASLTPIPAEYRNGVMALKSLPIINLEEAIKSLLNSETEPEAQPETPAEDGQPSANVVEQIGNSQADANPAAKPADIQIVNSNERNEGDTMAEQQASAPNTDNLATKDELKALTEQITGLVKALHDLPMSQNPGYVSGDGGNADRNIKSFGDFALAIYRGDETRLKTIYGSTKAIQEDQGVTGGYTVPTDYSTQLLSAQAIVSPIIALCRKFPVATASGDWPVLDLFTAPTAGSGNSAMNAGLISSVIAEGGAYTDRNVYFDLINWRVTKQGDMVKVSDETAADAPALDALLRTLMTSALASKKERNILRGNGVGEPLGILNAPALVNITPGTNDAFTWVDATTMLSRFKMFGGDPSRVRWVMHRSLIPDLGSMQIASGSPVTFVQSMSNGIEYPLLQYKLEYSEHLPQANNSGDAVLADFGSYALWERGDIRIGFSEHADYANGNIVWRFDERYDGQPWVKSSVTQADPQGSFTTSPFVNHND